jgi:hypothetical protein
MRTAAGSSSPAEALAGRRPGGAAGRSGRQSEDAASALTIPAPKNDVLPGPPVH